MTAKQISIVLGIMAVIASFLFVWIISRPKNFPQKNLKLTSMFGIATIAVGLILFLSEI